MIWTHISTDVEYRNPLGALRTGEAVRLSLTALPETYEEEEQVRTQIENYEIVLRLLGADGVWQEYHLEESSVTADSKENREKIGSRKDKEEAVSREEACEKAHTPSFQPVLSHTAGLSSFSWFYQWTAPEQAGVCWYYFAIRTGEAHFFYGPATGTSGQGRIFSEIPPSYQMTVYERDFETPEWFQNATMYQIFPDRYHRGRKENLEEGLRYHRFRCRKVYAHQSWEEIPYYRAMSGEKDYYPSDFFGGDLEGIRQNLGTLQEMGITCLYLNPIVEADSNHRYNTADYKKVDPILGTMEDFIQLCQEAERRGIRILLDGVYSHTGSDSIYFNKNRNYLEPGAYQQEASPFDSWYSFGKSQDEYHSWWGFETLPEVNELDSSWQEYIIKGKDSVFRHWLDQGAYGFRLDVADELPDEVIEEMRLATKQKNQDKVLLGEVWEDATTKESYGAKRTYALGKGLDSVMNYPFRDQTLAWLCGHVSAWELASFLNAQKANYPEPMYLALMNLLSSHDVARLRTVLGAGSELKGMSRTDQAGYRLDYLSERRAARLSRLAMLLQFTIPGVPSVYYGDEYGMCGLSDPFNRGTFEKHDPELAEYVKELSLLRRREKGLRLGGMSVAAYGDSVLTVLRLWPRRHACSQAIPAVPSADTNSNDIFLIFLNRSAQVQKLTVCLDDFTEGLSKAERTYLKRQSCDLPRATAIFSTEKSLPKFSVKTEADTREETSWTLSLCLNHYEGVVLHIH